MASGGLYKKILLLLDCSPVDRRIVDHVLDLAAIHGAEVHLFHVVHAHTIDQRRTLHAKSKECLTEAVRLCDERGVTVTFSTTEGEPSEQVLAKVDESGCDLIALATHGHGGFSDFVLGSVSRKLKHRCEKPILMMRGEP